MIRVIVGDMTDPKAAAQAMHRRLLEIRNAKALDQAGSQQAATTQDDTTTQGDAAGNSENHATPPDEGADPASG
jgi:hypothetical protein